MAKLTSINPLNGSAVGTVDVTAPEVIPGLRRHHGRDDRNQSGMWGNHRNALGGFGRRWIRLPQG